MSVRSGLSSFSCCASKHRTAQGLLTLVPTQEHEFASHDFQTDWLDPGQLLPVPQTGRVRGSYRPIERCGHRPDSVSLVWVDGTKGIALPADKPINQRCRIGSNLEGDPHGAEIFS